MKTIPKYFLHYFLILSAIMLWSISAQAEVRAILNQESYYEGDPITLTIEADSNSQAQPDFSPLNTDFEQVGGISSTVQSSINLNGHARTRKSWSVELQARKKGEIIIPAIMVGQEQTKPISVTITDIPADLEKETSKHVFIESSVEIAGKQPYVQQQIPYTVRLYYDSAMRTGKIYSPTVKSAVVEQLGEDRRYRTVRKGKKYSVIEKHFVISPEKSGKLHIPPTSVKGRLSIMDKRNNKRKNLRQDEADFLNRFFNNSPFGNDPFLRDFGGGIFSNHSAASKPFTANSEAIDVTVKPIPDQFTGNAWLPAEDLSIKDSWSKRPPVLRVGEPVTRVLTLRVKGLAGSQVPDFEIPKPNNVRMYPEQSDSETRTDGKTVYGIKEIKLSYIPDKKGSISIPKITLNWWNVLTKKQQTFTLPKWTLNIAAGIGGIETNNNPVAESQSDTAISKQQETVEKIENNTESKIHNKPANPTIWWIVAALGLTGILFSGYYLFNRKKLGASHKTTTQRIENSNKIKASLEQACRQNDAQKTAKLLLDYANTSWHTDNPPQNLIDLSAQVSQGSEAIIELNKHLYGKKNDSWKGGSLQQVINKGLKQKTNTVKSTNSGLTPLYPRG